jgi:osmotically-inducible protein OsmY
MRICVWATGYREEFAVMTEGEDERIQDDVSGRIAAELPAEAAQIQVEVTHGEVTLAGTVETSESRRRAEDVAGGITGVAYVINNLRVRQPGGTGATG